MELRPSSVLASQDLRSTTVSEFDIHDSDVARDFEALKMPPFPGKDPQRA